MDDRRGVTWEARWERILFSGICLFVICEWRGINAVASRLGARGLKEGFKRWH
jgi:hypothetical protein